MRLGRVGDIEAGAEVAEMTRRGSRIDCFLMLVERNGKAWLRQGMTTSHYAPHVGTVEMIWRQLFNGIANFKGDTSERKGQPIIVGWPNLIWGAETPFGRRWLYSPYLI